MQLLERGVGVVVFSKTILEGGSDVRHPSTDEFVVVT